METPNQLLGLWFGDDLGGFSCEASGRKAEEGREKGNEGDGEWAAWRPLWLVWYLLSATALNTVGL